MSSTPRLKTASILSILWPRGPIFDLFHGSSGFHPSATYKHREWHLLSVSRWWHAPKMSKYAGQPRKRKKSAPHLTGGIFNFPENLGLPNVEHGAKGYPRLCGEIWEGPSIAFNPRTSTKVQKSAMFVGHTTYTDPRNLFSSTTPLPSAWTSGLTSHDSSATHSDPYFVHFRNDSKLPGKRGNVETAIKGSGSLRMQVTSFDCVELPQHICLRKTLYFSSAKILFLIWISIYFFVGGWYFSR